MKVRYKKGVANRLDPESCVAHREVGAQLVWQILSAQGQKLAKEGKALETPEENLAELTAQANAFAEKQLPILKALQIA